MTEQPESVNLRALLPLGYCNALVDGHIHASAAITEQNGLRNANQVLIMTQENEFRGATDLRAEVPEAAQVHFGQWSLTYGGGTSQNVTLTLVGRALWNQAS